MTSCVCGDVAPFPLPHLQEWCLQPPERVPAGVSAHPPGSASRLPALPCPPCSRRHIAIPARQGKDGAPEQRALCLLEQFGTQKLLSWELVYCSALCRNARVESLQISLRHKIPELPFRSKSCSRPGQVHSGAASPCCGRCCGCCSFSVARWHHYIPENLHCPLF